MYRLGKAAYSKGYPGFESLSLRQQLPQVVDCKAKTLQFNELEKIVEVYTVSPIPSFSVLSDQKQYHGPKVVPRFFAGKGKSPPRQATP
jgi:hypothetical protein